MNKLTYSTNDNYNWYRATTNDLLDMLALSEKYYLNEIDNIISYDRKLIEHNLLQNLLTQHYYPDQHLILIAKDKENKLLSWSQISRNTSVSYSRDELLEIRFIHTDLTLPKKTMIKLLYQTLEQVILFQQLHKIPVLISTSMRNDQNVFMKIHEKMGFTLRGSIAYRRLQND